MMRCQPKSTRALALTLAISLATNVCAATNDQISFKAMQDSDTPLLFKWLKEPHVARWWWTYRGLYERFVERFNLAAYKQSAYNPFIGYVNGRPIAFIQYYNAARSYHTWKQLYREPLARAIGIDMCIGEPDCIGKGYGTAILKAFIQKIFDETDTLTILIDPDATNYAAIRCYQKVGFTTVTEVETRRSQAPSGKLLLMELKRNTPNK